MIFEESSMATPETVLLPLPESPIKNQSPKQPERPVKSPMAENEAAPEKVAQNLAPLFEKIFQKSLTQSPGEEQLVEDLDELKIVYQGRNVLDLKSNIASDWPFRPSTTSSIHGVFRFSEANNKRTVVRRMRDGRDGGYYYCYPSIE